MPHAQDYLRKLLYSHHAADLPLAAR